MNTAGRHVQKVQPHLLVFTTGVICTLLAADIAIHAVHAAPQAEPAKVVTAQEFRLVDKSGAQRATLGLQPDGSPYLSLSDKTNNRRISLRVRPDGGTAFAINDADGKNRMAMDTQPDGSAAITLSSVKGKGGAGFLAPADGTPVVIVKDKEGAVAFAEPHLEGPDDVDPTKPTPKK